MFEPFHGCGIGRWEGHVIRIGPRLFNDYSAHSLTMRDFLTDRGKLDDMFPEGEQALEVRQPKAQVKDRNYPKGDGVPG